MLVLDKAGKPNGNVCCTGNDNVETRKTTALTTVITGLKKFTNYSMQVLAFTKVGDGVMTAVYYCQTEEDGKMHRL